MAKKPIVENEDEPTPATEPIEQEQLQHSSEPDVLQPPTEVQAVATVKYATPKTPVIRYVRSRFAHRQAIRQWKLSRLMLSTYR
jgi:hypothetical protein